jgi:hypothetical protein
MRLVDGDALLEKWRNLSKRGRIEFDQVIMCEPTVDAIVVTDRKKHISNFDLYHDDILSNKGGNMNRKECENQILEKLREIKAIAKQYDKSGKFYLNLSIMDNYMMASNRYYENIKTPINVTLIDGKIKHWEV